MHTIHLDWCVASTKQFTSTREVYNIMML